VLVELFIFLTLAGTTAVLFQPLMGVVNKNTNALKDSLVRIGELALNRPIRYGSMSPSLIGSVEIYAVTVGERPDPLLHLDRLYLEYSLWDIIRGKGSGALRKLVLERPEIVYDPRRDGDLGKLFPKQRERSLPSLPQDGDLEISEGSFRVKTGPPEDTLFYLRDIYLAGTVRDGWVDMEGRWKKPESSGDLPPGDPPQGTFISSEGTLRGSFSGAFTGGDMFVRVRSVEGRGFTLNNFAIRGLFAEDAMVFSLVTEGLPLELSAAYIPSRGETSLTVSADQFVPAAMASLWGPLESLKPLLDLRLSGDASAVLGANPVYRFNLSADAETGEPSPVRGFALTGEGNARRILFSRCLLEARGGSVQYTGDILLSPFKPQGTISFFNFTLSGRETLAGALYFERRNQTVVVNSPYLSVGTVRLYGLLGELLWDEGTYNLRFSPGTDQGRRGAFLCEGTFNRDSPWVAGTIALNGLYVSDLITMAGPFAGPGSGGPWADKTALSTEISFFTDFRRLSYDTYDFRVEYESGVSFSASLSGTETYLDLSRGNLLWSGGNVRLDLHTAFESPGDMSFRCTVAYLDFSYDFEGALRDRRNLSIRGSNDFRVNLQYRQNEGWIGSASVYAAPVPCRGRRAYLYMDSALRYYNGRLWNASLNRFEIREFRGPGLMSTGIFVRGQASQNGLNLDRIDYEDRYGRLSGSAAAIWGSGFAGIDGSLVLTNEGETERVSADFFYTGGILEYHAAILGFKADRFAQSGKNLLVTGELFGVRNSDGYYSLSLSLDSLTGRTGETSLSASALALLDPEQLIVSQIRLSAGTVDVEIPYLSMDRTAGRLDTEGQISGRINQQDLGAVVSLGVNFQPLDRWLDLGGIAGALSGVLNVRHAFINDRETTEPFSFTFSRTMEEDRPGIIRLAGGPEDMLRLELRERAPGSSIFTAALSAPSPVQGTFTGTLEGTAIDGMATDVFVDLAGLWEITPINKTVNFTGGIITGETRIFGSIFDPEFGGAAWGSGVKLSVPEYVTAEIGPGTGDILLEGSTMSFGPIGAACGEGRGEITGWIEFNRWIPSLWLDIMVDRPVPFDFDISGIKARGKAQGKLNLLMENKEIFTITGDVEASDTEITVDAARIEQAVENPESQSGMDMVADISIRIGRRVEFLWPSSTAPLLRAYGDTGTGVRILSDSRIPHLALDGDINLRGGELSYLQRTFFIREGQIVFNGNDPRIDPRISARAEIRDQNDDGPVTITMVADSTPLSVLFSTIPRFESVPSLSQVEIYSLLGQAPPTGMEAEMAQDVKPIVGTAIDMVLQTVVFRRVERLVRNLLGVDMFSFRTQILQNAIFEAVRNREPDEQPGTMGTYLDKTSIFLGKYIGADLFLQGILNFRYDPYEPKYGGMKLEPDIGLEMRTPLFNLRWNVSLQHPKDLYVSDQSISILWHWSL
jgi:hypothetical protein